MNRSRRSAARKQIVPVATVFFLMSCTPPVRVTPPSTDVRAELSSVGLDVTSPSGPADIETPVAGKARGALIGAGHAGLCCLYIFADVDPRVFATGVLLAPPAAVGGGIYGAVAAPSAESVNTAHASLKKVTDETNVAMLVRDRLLSPPGPATDVRIVSAELQPNAEFGHVLEIEVSGPTFASHGKLNPDVTLFVAARARLRRVGDHASLYEGRWLYRGYERPYFDLAADDAALLRTDVDAAAGSLADKIRVDLFVPGGSDVARTPMPGEAAALPKDTQADVGAPSGGGGRRLADILSDFLSPTHCL